MSIKAPESSRQQLRFECDQCQARGSVVVEHYDRFACPRCNKVYWALRPSAAGLLVAYPWPGTPEMFRFKQQQQQQQKEAA